MLPKTLLVLSFIAAGAAGAAAHDTKAEIDAREARQLGEIEQGRQDGSITWREGRKLRAEQKFIATREQQMMDDGHLSHAERRELQRLQDEAARNIRSEASNDKQRAAWLPRVGR